MNISKSCTALWASIRSPNAPEHSRPARNERGEGPECVRTRAQKRPKTPRSPYQPRSYVRLVVILLASLNAAAAEPVGVVSHVKVVSSVVPDVSSIAAWKSSFISEGMSEKEKALATWKSVVTFQHQDAPPQEFLQAEADVLDPIKLFNVYGYSYCSVATANSLGLARAAGMKARGWTLNQHVVSEYSYDGSWHLLDGSLVTYFPKPDGSLAGVEEIVAGVKDWYGSNPDFKKNDKKLRQYMTGNGWKKGPTVLCNAPFYDDNGWLPAATHGWYATMEEYDGSTLFPYESGYSMGYEVNVQLRHGEKHTRNWFNHGLHVNMDGGGNPGCLNQRVGEENLRYTPKYGDVAPGRIGNGTLEYHFPLGDPEFRLAVVGTEGLACKSEDSIATALHVKKGSGSGNFVIRMPSSYVYLGGQLDLKAAVGTSGAIRILFSENNGLDWKELTTIKQSGAQTFDLKPFVFRRYDYRLKFEIQGANTGLDSLNIFHDIQHSQRPLPALLQGDNTLTFSAGPAEGTVTVEGAADVKNQKHQLVFTDFHPESSGLVDGKILLSGASGSISFPIATPGDLTRLRISTSYRARAPKDVWEVRVSFDQGKTFKTVDQLEGPTVGFGKYTVVSDVPPGVKSAVVQFVGTQRNTLMLTNLRISADYREPFGGFQPVKVTYLWDENGLPKQDVRIFKNPTETYHIHCAAKPLMKSLVMELAE